MTDEQLVNRIRPILLPLLKPGTNGVHLPPPVPDDGDDAPAGFTESDLEKFHDYYVADDSGHYHESVYRKFGANAKRFAEATGLVRKPVMRGDRPGWVWCKRPDLVAPGTVKMAEDAQGHEHKGSGEGGGQFVKKGDGSGPSDQTKGSPRPDEGDDDLLTRDDDGPHMEVGDDGSPWYDGLVHERTAEYSDGRVTTLTLYQMARSDQTHFARTFWATDPDDTRGYDEPDRVLHELKVDVGPGQVGTPDDVREVADELGIDTDDNDEVEWVRRKKVRAALVARGFVAVQLNDISPDGDYEHETIMFLVEPPAGSSGAFADTPQAGSVPLMAPPAGDGVPTTFNCGPDYGKRFADLFGESVEEFADRTRLVLKETKDKNGNTVRRWMKPGGDATAAQPGEHPPEGGGKSGDTRVSPEGEKPKHHTRASLNALHAELKELAGKPMLQPEELKRLTAELKQLLVPQLKELQTALGLKGGRTLEDRRARLKGHLGQKGEKPKEPGKPEKTPEPAAEVKPSGTQKPHEVTRNEFLKQRAGLGADASTVQAFMETHRLAVEGALAAKQPVPANVLADYPDLVSRQSRSEESPAHQMTRDQYLDAYRDAPDSSSTKQKFIREHRAAVESALAAGKPVPPEVLRDYPDLQQKAAPPAKPEPAPKPTDVATGPAPGNTDGMDTPKKEFWQMTPAEFNKHFDAVKAENPAWKSSVGNSALYALKKRAMGGTQEEVVRKAVAEGKPVPPEVLARFPDIKPASKPAPSVEDFLTHQRAAGSGNVGLQDYFKHTGAMDPESVKQRTAEWNQYIRDRSTPGGKLGKPGGTQSNEGTAAKERLDTAEKDLQAAVQADKSAPAGSKARADAILAKIQATHGPHELKELAKRITGKSGRSPEDALQRLRADLTAVSRLLESQHV